MNNRSFTFSRPRTLFGLALLSFSIVVAPLAAYALYAWSKVGKLAVHSEQLVVTGTELASDTVMLRQDLIALERNARQYHVTGDRKLYELFEERHAQWTNRLKLVGAIELNESVAGQVAGLLARGADLMDGLRREAPGSARMRIVLDEFTELNGLAAELSWASQRFVAARLGEILRGAREAQRAVPWQMGGLVAVTVSLSVVLAGLIAHPVRRTVDAIRKLGDGSFDKPIEIGGPPELAALGHQLDWLRRRLLQLEQDKDRFLRNVSHELKTPLASIREGAELLTDGSAGPLNATQDEIAGILNEAGAELQLLIENLLAYDPERLREGRLSPAVVDLRSFLAKVIARHRLVTARKCIDIHLDCPPLELDADPDKLAVLFDNLVSNAVKFAAKGGRVCIEVVGDNEFVTVDVLDDGPGVAPGDRDRIFQPFCQGHAAGETKVRGSGLGLAVARECAELHDGSLDVMDSPQGACFRVLLPRKRAKNVA